MFDPFRNSPSETNLTVAHKLTRWMWGATTGQRRTDPDELEEGYKG